MKANAEITKDRNLKIYVDMSEENSGPRTPDMWVTHVDIYNTNSYPDGI